MLTIKKAKFEASFINPSSTHSGVGGEGADHAPHYYCPPVFPNVPTDPHELSFVLILAIRLTLKLHTYIHTTTAKLTRKL